jgi:dTDP-4-amino-4,6-dideoxygalactose transaminase
VKAAPAPLALLGGPRAVPRELRFRPSPEITRDDEEAVLESLRGTNHAWGPHCVALQDEFARWNGNRFCAATNSGTAALHMGVAACGVRAGDEVITTTMSWTSSATSILHHNAIPVFVDVEWATMLIDPSRIEAAITPRTRAILPVHYWGTPCDMDAIRDIAARHGLAVIEDACQAHGSLYKGKKAGTLGQAAAFSLQASKNLCGGEGGLFVTDDKKLYQAGRALMSFGEMRAPDGERDFHAYGMGWMYRTSDLAAALALSQLRRLDATTEATLKNWRHLHRRLEGVPNLVRPFTSESQQTNGYAYVVRCDRRHARARGVALAKLRDALLAALQAEGVPVSRARWLLPAHTVFQARNGYGHGCPWTCAAASREVSYDLAQYQEGIDCVDSAIWIATPDLQPIHHPNQEEHMDGIAAAVEKVFTRLDELPIS